MTDELAEDIAVAAQLVQALQDPLRRLQASGPDDGVRGTFRAELDDDVFYEVLDGLKAMSGRDAHRFYHGLPYDGPVPGSSRSRRGQR